MQQILFSHTKFLIAYQEVLQALRMKRHSPEQPWKNLYMHTPFTLRMNFSHAQMICIANLYDCCKCIFYSVLFLYICMFCDMFHILESCDSLKDPWNVYYIVLYCI